ncbi:hypothetical protein Pcinc_040594 [Petrolisthes cinctipes]|uniref:Uncharacterized protein n=1 Tax=Petrolisthes cinctipes TaxID=88211 RepID=A0AAE1BMJ2_PETCI|nr:hypothetical protein Pcinc_040594 [Petrolisthes cinctipes]
MSALTLPISIPPPFPPPSPLLHHHHHHHYHHHKLTGRTTKPFIRFQSGFMAFTLDTFNPGLIGSHSGKTKVNSATWKSAVVGNEARDNQIGLERDCGEERGVSVGDGVGGGKDEER